MSYYRPLFSKAFLDSWDIVVESAWRVVGIGFFILLFSAIYTLPIFGREDVMSLLHASEMLFLGTVTVLFLVFLSNFFVFSPRHLYRAERIAREKAQSDLKANLEAQAAIPDITGAWNRIDIGTIEITRDESGFHSKFDINTFEHRGNPVFNAVGRRFEYVTTRYDSSNGTKRSYPEYLWVLDSDTLVFYAPKNAGDFPDSGVLKRAKT